MDRRAAAVNARDLRSHRTAFMRLLLLLLTLFAWLGPQVARADDPLPAPPTGYRWQKLDPIGARLLIPAGWFFRAEESRGTLAYFVTREKFDATGQFRVGLTLNCIKGVSRKAQSKPSEYVAQFAAKADAMYPTFDRGSKSAGPFRILWYSLIDAKNDPNAAHAIHYLVANDTTDTMYLFIFEAPVSEWEKYAHIGDVLLKNSLLETEY